MSPILVVFAGVIAALFVYWLTWYTRLNLLSLSVSLGFWGAVGITLFGTIFLTSDIGYLVLNALIILWVFALLVGYLQARSLPATWRAGVLSIFYEIALAFLIAASVNLTLQKFIRQLNGLFLGMEIYTFIDLFIRGFIVSLLVLAVIRPLIRLYKSRY